MNTQKSNSPRLKVKQAGLVILLGTIIIFGSILVIVIFFRSGCDPIIQNHQWGNIDGDLTISQPQLSTNFTRINTIRIVRLTSEQNIPVILTIMNSINDVFLNITHPHPLTHGEYGSREFTLQAYYMSSGAVYITLTIQRISNDTAVLLVYEAYSYSTLCVDYGNSLLLVIGGSIGGILIAFGFQTLNRADKHASWD